MAPRTRKSLTTYVAIVMMTLLTFACSPYIYKDEIGEFNEAVDQSIEYFEVLRAEEQSRVRARRDKILKEKQPDLKLSSGCLKYQRYLEETLGQDTYDPDKENLIPPCVTTPEENFKVDPVAPNLAKLGKILKSYAVSLVAITNAEDSEALEKSASEFRTNIESLLETLDQTSQKKDDKPSAGVTAFGPVSEILQQSTLHYLNQRRFNALKEGVEKAHPLIVETAGYLSEGATELHLITAGEKYRGLRELAEKASKKKDDKYLAAVYELEKERVEFVAFMKKNPRRIFHEMVDTHKILKEALMTSGDRNQIDAVSKNVKSFYESAKGARKAIENLLEKESD